MIVAVAAVVVVVDQAAKNWALDHLANARIDHVLPGLDLELTYNPGIAFGLGRGVTPVLVAGVVVIVVVLLGLGRSASRTASRLALLAMGLLLGGACGNLFDRLARHNHGAVIDFVHMRFWWVFNLADASIVLGAATLAILGSRGRLGRAKQ